jgi:hypothetical protein
MRKSLISFLSALQSFIRRDLELQRVRYRFENRQRLAISAIPALVAFFVAVVAALKAPELTAIILYELSKWIQSPLIRPSLDSILALRWQEHLALETLSQRMPASGEWLAIEIDPRSLTLGTRMKAIFLAGVTNISVIVPTLNEEKYLPSCLRSLRNQDYEGDFEIIVADGGSTDKTLDVAEAMSDRVIVTRKCPVGAARNEGAKTAKGETVAFIDADTWASTGWLSAIKSALQDPRTIGVTGPTLPYEGETLDVITYTFWTIYLQRMLLSLAMPHVIGFNCAYRKQPFLLAGGFDEASVTSEDIRLARRMRKRGRIVFERKMSALTSPRRFRRYGHAYIAGLYVLNGFSTLLLNRSTQRYPPVR